ncbi:tetratricopeptide repeat protein [Parabacteroides sp. OttesenSCG-928-G07]|nr:tetratricopeptide repeat protein [Parabacteroides sp. OttesenSCG-928-G07]
MHYRIRYIILFLAVCLLSSCSTQKNTRASRFYQAFTTRYNVYYNGKVSFDEQLDAMQNGYKENYTEMIYMHPISAQPKDKQTTGGPFDRAIEKSNKAIKLHSISVKPEKKPGWRNDPKQVALQEQEEYNPFLKNSWLMLGQAQFYNADFLQAAATFSYISRHYSTDPVVSTEARIWQARCYTEMDWFFEAEDVLDKLNKEGFPKKNSNLYAAVNANVLIKEGKFEEAVPYLQTAIKAEKNKLQRTRMRYLLGQIYTTIGMDGMAYEAFGKVANSGAPYELEFAARIRQTEVFGESNYQKVVKQLERMAKNEKNKDLLDQVYYALGNIYLNRQDTVNAIRNYHLGIDKSTRHGMDKAICQIKLGDIYFNMRDYINAQPCFSGALSAIQKEYKDYERVSKLSAVLDELVIHAEAVHLQDSLQTLARMPETERLAAIDKIIAQVIKEEEEAKALAEREAYLAQQDALGGIDRPGTEINATILPTASDGAFYFYNAQIVAQGKTQFQRIWGRRTLEDNWRRRNKTMSTFSMDTDDIPAETVDMATDEEGNLVPANDNEALLTDLSSDTKSREYYLQQLPLTPEDMEASDLIIEDGLYNMAMIYKDKLEDLPLSIEGFETLERRFPDSDHRLESYYQIYLMALRLGDAALAETYKQKLIGAFPESDYAVAIADPNYEYNIRMMDRVQDSLYQRTYKYYQDGNVTRVRQYYRTFSQNYPLASLMPKFMFLNALTYVETGDVSGFTKALQDLLEKYPNADVSEVAGEMLKGVLRGRELVQGNVQGMKWNMRFGLGEDGGLSAADAARTFSAETNTPFRMLLIYPTGSLDKNQLLFAVAAFNFSSFIVKQFDLSVTEEGPISMLMIDGFYNFEEIVHYYRMIYDKDGYAEALGRNVTILPISLDNYEVLMRGKTVEEYIDFFEEHFGELAPEMLARWSAHYEADMQEPEEGATKEITASEPIRETPVEVIETEIPTIEEDPQQLIEQIRQEDTGLTPSLDTFVVDSLMVDPELIHIIEVETDTVPTLQSPPVEEGLTLKEIEEIRQREAEEEAARQEIERQEREAREQMEKEAKEQQAKDREERLKQAEAERKTKEKEQTLLLKDREKELKAKQKAAEAERKAREKAQRELQKQREKEYKQRLQQLEKERKAKEKAYQQQLKQREKERREALKAREAAARGR